MIGIQQGYADVSGLDKLLATTGEVTIGINKEAIAKDILEIKEKMTKLSSKSQRTYQEVINHLVKMIDRSNDGDLDLAWTLDNYGVLKAYPLDLTVIPVLNIDMAEYIKIKDEKLVRVSYSDVAEIIAFEMMHRDMDEETTSSIMEKKLRHLGVTCVYPASELLKHCEDGAYEWSATYMVGNSPYYAADNHELKDYFGMRGFKSQYYREAVDFSVRKAWTIIVNSIVEKLVSNCVSHKLCAVNSNGIYITVKNENLNFNSLFKESVVVRAFGRRFEVEPEITVF